MSERTQIFRKVALERLSSPEQLDRLVHVITPRAWLVWLSLGAIVFAAMLWSIFGSVSTVVSGRAILLQKGGLAEVSSTAQGRVLDLNVDVGTRVAKGQRVARIAQPELVERQRQAIERLAELERQESRLQLLLQQSSQLNDATLAQSRATLGLQIKAADERMRILEERISSQRTLLDQGLITRQTLLRSESDLTALRLETENLRGQVQQLSLKRLEARRLAEAELTQLQAQTAEARRVVDGLAESERLTTLVESPFAGRIVEIRVAPGALVTPGTPLITIEPDGDPGQGLEAAIYLAASEGKQVSVGMLVQISPATVRREEYGYLIGEVTFVSDYPATVQSMRATLQNEELVKDLSGSASPIEVRARLQRSNNASGYRWSSPQGPPVKVTAGTPAHAAVVVRQQAPISFVIPALRQVLGGS